MTVQLTASAKAAMDRIAGKLATKSDKIRALGQAGYARGDIARYLDVRYQHVRNVLVHAAEKRERATAFVDQPPNQEWTKVGPDGRVVIPVAYRRALGVADGGPVLMILGDGAVQLLGRDAAVRRAQAMFAPYVKKGVSLSDELIADRRAEVAREQGDG